jgi:hydrogenase nickel incorporation protein HypA/HybF
MHERPFTQRIVEAILASLKDYPAGRVTAARVSVGEVFHLVPDSVRTHFESLTAGTPLAGSLLELEETPLRVQCRDCGQMGPVTDHHAPLCGACGSLSVDQVAGHEIRVESFSLRVPEESNHGTAPPLSAPPLVIGMDRGRTREDGSPGSNLGHGRNSSDHGG